MITKFLDTFTDPNGTLLDAHTPDLPLAGGFGWSAGYADIQGNKLSSTRTAPPSWDIFCGTTNPNYILYGVGDEISCDVERYAATVGLSQGFSFLVQSAVDFIRVELESLDAANVGFAAVRYKLGAANDILSATHGSMPSIAMASTDVVRFGVTIIDGTHFQFWVEPAGGGTRTILVLDDGGVYTDSNGYYVVAEDTLNAAHKGIGIWTDTGGVGTGITKDNLMVQGRVWTPCDPALGSTSWSPC